MLKNFSRPRRVVITGMGCVTPIGIGREAFWHSLASGISGVRKIESFDVSDSAVKIAGEVRDFDWESQLSSKDRKHVPRTVPLALAAAHEALADAGIDTTDISMDERRSIGVEIGTGGGGLAFAEKHYEYWYIGPKTHASVYIIPASTHGGLSSEISMTFGLRGLSHVVSTGCTSSTDAIFYAAQHIALGRQDVMIAGRRRCSARTGNPGRVQPHDRFDKRLERRAASGVAAVCKGPFGNSRCRGIVHLRSRISRFSPHPRCKNLRRNIRLRRDL